MDTGFIYLIALLVLFVSGENQQYCQKWTAIESGNTCWSVADLNGISVELLKSLNPKVNCDALWVGQKLCVKKSLTKPKCTKTYKIANGDFCFKIWSSNNFSEDEFMDMNSGIDCDKLAIGMEVCIGIEAEKNTDNNHHLPALPLVEDEQTCHEFVTIKKGDTCSDIITAYNLNETTIKNKYDCNNLQIGDTMCVSANYTCQLRYPIKKGDTCYSIGKVFKLNSTDLETLNEGLKCDKLMENRMICVWSTQERHLVNMTCTAMKKLEKGLSCIEISTMASIPFDEFSFLNPNINCENIVKSGATVCQAGANSVKCSSLIYLPVNTTATCSKLTQQYSMSNSLLMKLNPTLNCDKLNQTKQICIGQGYYKDDECTETLRVDPDIDNCEKIVNSTGLTAELIRKLNPGVDCNKKLNHGYLVCVQSLGMTTQTAQEIVVSNLRTLVPELSEKFQTFLKNPTEQNGIVMNQLMMTSIQKPEVNEKMKMLYKKDASFRKIIDSQDPFPRKTYCDQVMKLTTTEVIKSCFCGTEELVVYCRALALKQYEENEAKALMNLSSSRIKRAIGCEFITPMTGESILDKINSAGSTCWGAGCTIPFGLVEVSIEANMCLPVVNIADEGIRFCTSDGNDCMKANPDRMDELKVLADRSVGGSLKLCAIGSSLIRKLASAGSGLCWDIITTDYYGFVGKLSVGSSLQLIVIKFNGGAKIKVHDMLYPKMCERSQLECEDYCKWQDWPNGKAYGYIEGRVLSIFGWDGIPIFDETIKEPRALGCQAGKESAIALRNERTCKNEDDRRVWRCCWSGDDKKCTFQLMDREDGFHFKPNIWGSTLFVCEFIDKDLSNEKKKIGFDVYGGKSKNKGKKTFYYVAKNDGVYFGEEKYKEDKLMKAFDSPCEGQEEVNAKKDQGEPNGESSVPAAGCGKRIVGYYTGWGDREITENQVKKLTHVIFAFVAMYADGSVRFGPVSEDDSGPEAAVKAKRRFLDMRDKARLANNGIHILFAVGGWDNSQYFSSVAGDSGKRKHFIDSVVEFIVEHRIDGVDLDWEYPDMKGGDKKNHVTLLKELRERLDNLQKERNRKSRFLITLASAAGEWNLRDGYDLNGVLKYADFINVMTYDYYGAWGSKWGAYTGPPAPLYFGSLKGFSGKLNADFTMKFYTCRTKKPSQLNMGVPFYGRYWKNVQGPIDGKDEMWRTAEERNGKFEGGYVGWRNLEREGWNKNAASWHDKTKTPFIMNSAARKFMGFENEKSLSEKVKYAIGKNLGGLMIWALDLDDDADTLLNLVSSSDLCSGGSGNKVTYTCNPIDEVRWWNPENSDESRQGQCGKSAPLINGYYPVCDPDDPGFACCGAAGYCGSEKEYCDCKTCVNYRKDPMLIVKEPIKPTRAIQWYTMSDPDGKRGRCGKEVPTINGKMAICNPDDDSKHCCSNGGYCGTGKEFCECDGCVDYKKKS